MRQLLPYLPGIVLTGIMTLLAGCSNDYPDNWPALEHASSGECPDISGSYRIASTHQAQPGIPGLEDTLFRDVITDGQPRFPWEIMTLSGDPEKEIRVKLGLTPATLQAWRQSQLKAGSYAERQIQSMQAPQLRWSGGFARMTDEQYEKNLSLFFAPQEKEHVLKKGIHYICVNDWISGDRLDQNHASDQSNPRQERLHGVVRFARDEKKYLVALSEYKTARDLTAWCGEPCKGITPGMTTAHEWRRWSPAQATSEVEIQQPWSADFTSDVSLPSGMPDVNAAGRLQEVRAIVTPLLPPQTQLHAVESVGHGVMLTINSKKQSAFAQLIEAIEQSFAFMRNEVRSMQRQPDGTYRMNILLTLKEQLSLTPTGVIEAWLRPLLPTGVELRSVSANGAGFKLDARVPDNAAIEQLMRNLEQSAQFQSPRVETIFTGAENLHLVVIQFRER